MSLPQTAATAGAHRAPGRPAQQVVAALFVDFGDNKRAPRARYECVRCGFRSEIVTGPAAVAAFTATASDNHRYVCPALQETSQ